MHSQITRMVDDFQRGRLSRRQLIGHLTAVAAAIAAVPIVSAQDAPASEPASTFKGLDVNHIALRVTDIDRSRAFYQKHLGLTVASQSRTSCFMRCADKNFVALFKAAEPRMHHYCYAVEGYEAGRAVERLKAAGLSPRRESNRVYFDDPDGLMVQVAAPYRRRR